MGSDKRWELIDRLLDLALAEDVGEGDITTESLVEEDAQLAGSFGLRSQRFDLAFVVRVGGPPFGT